MSSLTSVLESLGLQTFADAFAAEGFENAADILELPEDELRALAKDLGLGRGHTVRLLRWFKESSGPPIGAAAAAVAPVVAAAAAAAAVAAPAAPAAAAEHEPEPEHEVEPGTSIAEKEELLPSPHAAGQMCAVAHDDNGNNSEGEKGRAAFLWCSQCTWVCQECTKVHRNHESLFPGHILSEEPPPRPFWEDLNYELDNESKEVLTVDFKDPRLVKRDLKNWRRRLGAATDDHIPVVSFVGPTGSGKSFLLSSLMAPDERKANGPTVSTPGQHVPESGNVFVFDSNPIGDFPRALLVDFEGEDGDVPKSLLRRIGKYANKRVGGVSQGLNKAVGGMVQMGGQMVSKVTKGHAGKLFEKKLGGGYGGGGSGGSEDEGRAENNGGSSETHNNDDLSPPSLPSSAAATTPPMSPANELPPLEDFSLSGQKSGNCGNSSSGSSSSSSSSSSNHGGEAASPGLGSRSGLIGALEQLGDEWNYELWSTNRRDTVNTVLPVLAYLLSDVIVFVDTVEPRRLQAFFERVQDFATTAWAGCQASGWMPALIMVQNKWHYSEEDPAIDITDQFSAHVDRDKTLGAIFTSVHFLRLPHSSYSSALTEAHTILNATVAKAAAEVHARRAAASTLYTEKDWWLLAPQLAEEYSRSREPVSLPRLQLRALQPAADDRGVDSLFLLMDNVTRSASLALNPDQLFEETKRRTLVLYRLSVALQMRRRGHTFEDMFSSEHESMARERYQLANRVIEQYRCCAATFTVDPPCSSNSKPDWWDPKKSPSPRCTQLRKGHEATHRNPQLMEASAEAGTLRAWFGWKHQVPMQWAGEFAMPEEAKSERLKSGATASTRSRENDFVTGLRDVCALPTDHALFWRYVTAAQELGVLSTTSTSNSTIGASLSSASSNSSSGGASASTLTSSSSSSSSSLSPTWHRHTCLRCLSPVRNGAMLRRLSECGHFCCSACLDEGRRACYSATSSKDHLRSSSQSSTLVSCPFCAVESKWSSSAEALVPPGTGPRVLCLDGGGVRGLVEVTILKHLCRLSGGHGVTDLFDVIGGTSTGGILAIAFGAMKLSPEAAHDMYVALTGRIFARRGLSTVLPDLVSIAMGHSIFANAALQDGLEKAFGGKHNTFGDFPLLPKFFVTAFDVIANTTAVFGNFEFAEKRTNEEEGGRGSSPAQGASNSTVRTSNHVPLVKAAMASSAAPMYFPPITIDDDIFADGGMDANCPVVEALGVAEQLFPGEPLEVLLSLGAGHVGPATVSASAATRRATAGGSASTRRESNSHSGGLNSSSSSSASPFEAGEAEKAAAAAAAAAVFASKRAEVEGRGAEWISHLVSLQMEANRIWNQAKAHQKDDVKAAMLRLNPPELGAIDPFHAHRCREIVALTEAALQEPTMASELCHSAAKLRAKLYFLSTDRAETPGEGEGGERRGKSAVIKATAGDIIRFQVLERSVAQPSLLPRARVRRFEARAVHVKTTDKPAGKEAEIPSHLPSFSSLLKQSTGSKNAKNDNNNSDSNSSSADGSINGLWRSAGDSCEYTVEALAGCVDFRFKPLPPTSTSMSQQKPLLANEGAGTPSNIAAAATPTPTTTATAASAAAKLVTLAVEVCLVEAAVGGGETRHPVSGCPKFVTFEVFNSAPEAPGSARIEEAGREKNGGGEREEK